MKINWYPGHMAKTKRLMQEDIRQIDLVCELRDARIPLASRSRQRPGKPISPPERGR